jgi:hypothetical protein
MRVNCVLKRCQQSTETAVSAVTARPRAVFASISSGNNRHIHFRLREESLAGRDSESCSTVRKRFS